MSNLLKKFLSFSYGSWIGLILGLLTTMLTTRILNPEDLGKASMYTLALNISMIIVMFGTDQSFIRFFYEEKKEKQGKLLYNSLFIPLILSLLVSIILMIFNKQVALFLFGEDDIFIVIILALGIISQLVYRYARLVIRMQQKGNKYSILEIVNKLLNLILLLALFHFFGASYEILVYSTFFTLVLLALFSVLSEKNHWSLRNLLLKDSTHSKKDIIKYGSPFVLTLSITWLFQTFDQVALRQFSTFEELGLYSAAARIVSLVAVIQTTFSTFWTPISYERYQQNPSDTEFYSKVSKIVSFVMFFVAIGSIVAKDIIVMLLGSEYRYAAEIMPFLVFMPILYTISETTVIGINFSKNTKWHILIASASCILNILGNILLVPSYGAIGAAISTAVSYLLFFTLRTRISLKYYKVNYSLKRIYFMVVLVGLYALMSITLDNFYANILMGIISVSVLIGVYFSEVIIIKNIVWKKIHSGEKQ